MDSEQSRVAAQEQPNRPGFDRDRAAENGHLDSNGFVPATPADDVPLDDGPIASKPAKSGGRAIREIVETLLLALVIFVGVRLIVLNFRVDGESMIPNLTDGEMLLVNRNVYFHFDMNGVLDALPFVERDSEDIVYPFHPPERGDIVVFNPPVQSSDKPYIKRVIGLPGERVTFEGENVFIDGVQLNEPYIVEATDCRGNYCDTIVPEGHIYVLGDNRNNSSDSRSFGVVDVDDIIGKAWIGYWPMDEIGIVDHYDYPEISDR
jgi:signal peptidase I